MTAGIDLVLSLIDNDLGPETAKMVARLLVMNQYRMGGLYGAHSGDPCRILTEMMMPNVRFGSVLDLRFRNTGKFGI